MHSAGASVSRYLIWEPEASAEFFLPALSLGVARLRYPSAYHSAFTLA